MRTAFERLRRCHRRLEETLAELTRIADALAGGAAPSSVVDGLEDALAFLGRQVARHEADEEASLFPRIADVPELVPHVKALIAEHEVQRGLVKDLRAAREARDVDAVVAVSRQIVASYARHIELEERDVFPVAEQTLSADALRAMEVEMEERRGG